MLSYQNFIHHQFVNMPESANILHVDNPATTQTIASIQLVDHTHVLNSIEYAKQAQRSWRQLPAHERGQHLQQLATAIDQNAQNIGQILAQESGKSLEDAINEAHYAAEITRYHAQWARRIEGEIIQSDQPRENLLLLREPLGVVVCLIPFNYPIYTLMRKIAPALIAGNSVIVRVSNYTPCSAFVLAEAILTTQLPAGLIQIMAMDHDVAKTLCTHTDIAMLSLTGGIQAGQQILGYCQYNMAKPSLELGGKTPVIIADDTDLDHATDAIVSAKTTHCGQLCTAVERVYAHHDVYSRVCQLLKDKMQNRQYGNRLEYPEHMGPLISQSAQQRTHQMVQRAIAEGARLETGGYLPNNTGYFYPPTVLSGCQQHMEIIQAEIFAPVLCIMPYQDFSTAIKLANDHQYGLSAVLYTERYRDIMYAANTIEAGEFYVNRMPADPYQGFHAGWKRSGLGGDDGKHGMLAFTQTRLVVLPH